MLTIIDSLIEIQDRILDIKSRAERIKELSNELDDKYDSKDFSSLPDIYGLIDFQADCIAESLDMILGHGADVRRDNDHAMQCITDLRKFFNNDVNDGEAIATREDAIYASDVMDILWRFVAYKQTQHL